MDEPDQEPTEKPTQDRHEAEQEGKWMARNWMGIAVISILTLLLLAVGLMQATGLVDVFAPVADSQTGQWAAFGVLALVVVAIAGWSWRAIVS
jgi:flagellar biosynthesis protein FlhB